jgi:isoquinoline 1-oxidoreductase beta subunit
VPWGTLRSFDEGAVKGRAGILAVTALKAVPGKTDNSDLQDCVAVVADSWWRAKGALDALPIEWDYGPYAHVSTHTQRALARQRLEQAGDVVGESSEGALFLGKSR